MQSAYFTGNESKQAVMFVEWYGTAYRQKFKKYYKLLNMKIKNVRETV